MSTTHTPSRVGRPQKAILLVRISDDRRDDDENASDSPYTYGRSVANQIDDGIALAARIGWGIGDPETHIVVEDSVSAYKRKRIKLPDGSTALRTVRPEFRRALGMLATGDADGLLAYDLDRTARDPRDLEDLIDVIESKRTSVESVTGSLRLSNDAEITMARVLVAVANKSSRDTGRRVARMHESLAQQGKPSGGGFRAYGYTKTWEIIPAEAAVIREIYERVCCKGMYADAARKHGDRKGDSLRAIAADFNKRGIPTVRGGKWSTRNVNLVATKPAVAALRVHKGAVVGKAEWDPVLTAEEHAELCAVIAGRSGNTSKELKRWLTGSLYCHACGRNEHLVGWTGRKPRYWCATPEGGCGKTSVVAEDAEAYMARQLIHVVTHPDWTKHARASLATMTHVAEDLRADIAEDEKQLKQLGIMWAKKEISFGDYKDMKAVIQKRLAATRERTRTTSGLPASVRKLITGEDAKGVVKMWGKATPEQKRELFQSVFPSGWIVGPYSGARPMRFEPQRLQLRDPDPGELPPTGAAIAA